MSAHKSTPVSRNELWERPVEPTTLNRHSGFEGYGYDAGKKIKGRKRQIVIDMLGLLVGLIVHGADIQDRDGAPEVLKSS
jgi:hypothetical protein